MKIKLLSFVLALIGTLALTASAADKPDGAKKLLHVVSFKFKPAAAPEQITQVVDDFRALKKTIRGIAEFEWGTNVSPEKHDKGFTHLFVLTFKNEKDRDEYLVHPDHKAFGKTLGPILDDVFVIDSWVQK